MSCSEFTYPNQKWVVLWDVQSNKYYSRILRPIEFELLLEGAKTEENQLRLQVALITGMRFEELRRFDDHPEWYTKEENFIMLPEEYKVKRRHHRRYIKLPRIAKEIIPRFFELKLKFPSIHTWIENLKRWMTNAGLDPSYMGARSLRKTWESWLVVSFPDRLQEIVLSQGHTRDTALTHYFNIPFTEKDRQMMRKWIDGWGD